MDGSVLRRRAGAAAGTYASIVLGFLGTLVAARVFSTELLGLYTLVIASAGFFQTLLDLTIEEALIKFGFRYIAREDWGRLRRLFRRTFGFKLLGATLAGGALVGIASLHWPTDGRVRPPTPRRRGSRHVRLDRPRIPRHDRRRARLLDRGARPLHARHRVGGLLPDAARPDDRGGADQVRLPVHRARGLGRLRRLFRRTFVFKIVGAALAGGALVGLAFASGTVFHHSELRRRCSSRRSSRSRSRPRGWRSSR